MSTHKGALNRIIAMILAFTLVLSMASVAYASELGAAIGMSTEARNLEAGDYFTVDVAFLDRQESNVAQLSFNFNDNLFEYSDYAAPSDRKSVV